MMSTIQQLVILVASVLFLTVIGTVFEVRYLRHVTYQQELNKNPHPFIPTTTNVKVRTFWTSDLHDGTRIDMPSLLVHLHQSVIVNGGKGSKGPYPDVLNRFKIPGNLSPTISSHYTHSQDMTEDDIKSNFEFYKNDPIIAGTDAFICSFPAAFCEMWMPFNKTIILLPAHRFSLGRCSRQKFDRLIQHVIQLNQSNAPKNFIAANSVYDAEYLNYYTGIEPILLPSHSFFYAGRNTTNYTKSKSEILVGPLQLREVAMATALEDACRRKNATLTFKTAKQLYGRYNLQNLADHRAAVLFPYAVMSFGMTELYAMAIPLFVPSIDMILQYKWTTDRTLIDPFYCGPGMADQLPPRHNKSRHELSPDTYETTASAYWLQFADFYQWPHVTVFSSFDDLIEKLQSADYDNIHNRMLITNQQREIDLLIKWRSIIKKIEIGRQVPHSYEEAMSILWNTTKLQAD